MKQKRADDLVGGLVGEISSGGLSIVELSGSEHCSAPRGPGSVNFSYIILNAATTYTKVVCYEENKPKQCHCHFPNAANMHSSTVRQQSGFLLKSVEHTHHNPGGGANWRRMRRLKLVPGYSAQVSVYIANYNDFVRIYHCSYGSLSSASMPNCGSFPSSETLSSASTPNLKN
eukprot:1473615-Rhodomonas_salina.2